MPHMPPRIQSDGQLAGGTFRAVVSFPLSPSVSLKMLVSNSEDQQEEHKQTKIAVRIFWRGILSPVGDLRVGVRKPVLPTKPSNLFFTLELSGKTATNCPPVSFGIRLGQQRKWALHFYSALLKELHTSFGI